MRVALCAILPLWLATPVDAMSQLPCSPEMAELQRSSPAFPVIYLSGLTTAVAGGFAVIEHGYERFTKDVDLLVYAGDLLRAIEVLRPAGLRGGRTPIGARLRDEQTNVGIDLLGTAFEGDERALAR